jgi:hypothetical protein
MLEAEDPFCLSDVILAETLQGFRDNKAFDAAKIHRFILLYTVFRPPRVMCERRNYSGIAANGILRSEKPSIV